MKKLITLTLLLMFGASTFAQIDIVKRKVTLDSLDGRNGAIWTSGNLTPQDSGVADIGSDSIPYHAIYGDSVVAVYIEATGMQGQYLPVESDTSNIDLISLDSAGWYQVGKTVTVYGQITIDPTTTLTATFFSMDLPAGTVKNTWSVGGTFGSYQYNESGAVIYVDATHVLFQFFPTEVGERIMSYQFSYRIP